MDKKKLKKGAWAAGGIALLAAVSAEWNTDSLSPKWAYSLSSS